jgi:hypothetical protein
MEVKITIAQPYPVIWSWDDSKEEDIILWMRANLTGRHEGFWMNQGSQKIVIDMEQGVDHWKIEGGLFLWLFENVRDALLFKLTWGGT